MAQPVNIGFDFGSLGCRASWVSGGDTVSLPGGADWTNRERWLLCESDAATALGVRFSPLKSLLGVREPNPGQGLRSPSATVRQTLAELRRLTQDQTGRPPGELVISVPAFYSSARRTTLRDLALATGFPEVHLLNDGTAAVIAMRNGSKESRRILVWSMGYAGLEVSIVQADGEQYQALGYRNTAEVGGAAFDLVLLRSCIQYLRDRGILPFGFEPAPEQWIMLRRTAEILKEDPGLVLTIHGAGQQVPLTLLPADLDRTISSMLAAALDSTETLLEQRGLKDGDIDDVLLVGGSTRIPAVARVVGERFGKTPLNAAEEFIARGAALYANSRKRTAVQVEGYDRETGEDRDTQPLPPMSLAGTTLPSEDRATIPGPEEVFDLRIPAPLLQSKASEERGSAQAQQSELDYVRQLIAQGAYEIAVPRLERLIDEAKALLAQIPRQRSENHFQSSYDLLRAGESVAAVSRSHELYDLDKENPRAFLQMIDIHCQAGMMHSSFEEYDTSIRILMCAHQHDATNRTVHLRIAERQFVHARELADRGQRENSLRVLDQCLDFNPEHVEAQALRATLRARTATEHRL